VAAWGSGVQFSKARRERVRLSSRAKREKCQRLAARQNSSSHRVRVVLVSGKYNCAGPPVPHPHEVHEQRKIKPYPRRKR
jgi:hypothetical protein